MAYRYKAFISYSWSDARWGKWLHNAVETYRTPRSLIGTEGRRGPVAARLKPLFKDREEEAAGSSIGNAVDEALNGSEFLVVICSPRSAQSQWVNREIAWFKTHRDPANILALIVDGEPGASAIPGREHEECFPKALTHRVTDQMEVTDAFEDAPLAADARESGDGKRGARLKIAAALLGVGLDELVNRDARRRAIRMRIVVAASLTLALVMSGLTLVAVQARNEADRQRAEADGLVEFMLTDLREKLEPVGRLDALDVVGQRALAYYARQKLSSLDGDSLGRRSRALHLVGEVSNIRGDSEVALTAFKQAANTTSELLARDPSNQQRIFDHAQSVFWVGYIAYTRGEQKDAEAQYREYKRLADQLISLNPGKPEWQMESSYAESNLGVMLNEQERHAEAEPFFARGLKRIEAVAQAEGYDAGRQIEVGETLNWLGQTKSELGKHEEALSLHQREVTLFEDVLKRDRTNAQAKYRLAVALQFVGDLEVRAGKLEAGIAAYQESLTVTQKLRELEPRNTEWQETQVRALLGLAKSHISARRFVQAEEHVARADRLLKQLIASDPNNEIWSIELRDAVSDRRALLP